MRLSLLCFPVCAFVCLNFAAASPGSTRLLTHSTDFARVAPARWVAEGWRVANPDPGVVAAAADGARAFVVATPHTAMSWTLTVEPIWTDPFATLALSYFVEGAPADDGAFIELFDGSTGPITPGATNNENPLASGGRYRCGTLAPGLHVEVVDLAAVEKLDRVAEITITVRAGDGPVAVRLNQLLFLADPAQQPEGQSPLIPTVAADNAPVMVLQLPADGAVELSELERALGMAEGAVPRGPLSVGGLPFTVTGHAAATPLTGGGAITLKGPARGGNLALLCAARLWGSGEGWYSASAAIPRPDAPHAVQFRVALRYEDASVAVAIPRRLADGRAGLQPGIGAYAVSLDPGKTLVEAVCIEDMSYGQVAVLAASVLEGAAEPAIDGRRPEKDLKPEEDLKDSKETAGSGKAPGPGAVTGGDTASVLEDPEWLVLEGETLRLTIDRDAVVHGLEVGEDRRELVTAPFALVALAKPGGAPHVLRFVEALQVPARERLVVLWAVEGEPLQLELALAIREDGGLVCTPALSNLGNTPARLYAAAPRLRDLQFGEGSDTEYMLGARSAIEDSAPIDLAEVYGGQYPLQFMDVHDKAGGAGLACMVLDGTLRRKWFEFKKDAGGSVAMGISYRGLDLAPGERLALPPTVLLPHGGDWRVPFQTYAAWARKAFPRTRSNTLADVFYCRRDYPLGGTAYLYDPSKRAYTFEKLLSESKWAFGGAGMVDISGWAYSEALGRVGTYRDNDLGGLAALATGVKVSHASDAKVGLYFEGYLLDKRAATAQQGLATWQLVRAGNKPAWWPGEMEFFCCPGAKGWQDQLAGDIAAVAQATGADAVYVDQLGICGTDKECWSPLHGHPVPSNPIAEEIALLKRVREELDPVRPDCAIYIEHLPCDAMMPYIDGAFNLGMKHTRHVLGPAKLPLHRYLFPEVPVFEMVAHGIRPIPAEADDLKLAFFHGMGLWLKGRGASWYSAGFRGRAPEFHAVLADYARFFRSPEAEPRVDTLMDGVYANRFPHGNQVLYTLYNANPITVSGPLLAIPPGATAITLYGPDPLEIAVADGFLGAAPFFPEEVAAVLVTLPE